MTDHTERQYESIDRRAFTIPNHMDVDHVRFLPNRNHEIESMVELGYVNPMAIRNMESKHAYKTGAGYLMQKETEIKAERRQRAKTNQVYEGFDSNENLTKTKIFESIRNINYPVSVQKKQCRLTCVSVVSLILVLFSLTASGYMFYRIEIKKSVQCSCSATKVEAYVGEDARNKTEPVEITLLSKQVQRLQENIKFLEKKLNETKIRKIDKELKDTINELSKINNSLNAGSYWTHSLQQLYVLDKKVLVFSKNLTWMKEILNETRTLAKTGGNMKVELNRMNITINKEMLVFSKNLTWMKEMLNQTRTLAKTCGNMKMEFNRMNITINKEVAALKHKLAGKGSFRNCTLEMIKKTDIFKTSSFDSISFEEKKSSKQKIVGVTCAYKINRKTQYSRLQVNEDDTKVTYTCECSRQLAKKPSNDSKDECTLYYWQCPNT